MNIIISLIFIDYLNRAIDVEDCNYSVSVVTGASCADCLDIPIKGIGFEFQKELKH